MLVVDAEMHPRPRASGMFLVPKRSLTTGSALPACRGSEGVAEREYQCSWHAGYNRWKRSQNPSGRFSETFNLLITKDLSGCSEFSPLSPSKFTRSRALT